LRSLTARYPWAVFGLGPLVLLAASMVGALYLEIWLLNQPTGLFSYLTGQPPGTVTARLATRIYTAYNTLVVYGAPLIFAWLFYWLGLRQRIHPAWIVTGVAVICVLGGFQNLIFYDKGYVGGGVLLIQSGLLTPFGLFSPFPYAEGVVRAAMNLAIAGGVWWWLTARKKGASKLTLPQTART